MSLGGVSIISVYREVQWFPSYVSAPNLSMFGHIMGLVSHQGLLIL